MAGYEPIAVVVGVRVATLLGRGDAVDEVVGALTPHFRQHRLQRWPVAVQVVGDHLTVPENRQYIIHNSDITGLKLIW